jgi:predicted membrane channel-forming protein YqfA (hemolysin III family)
MPPLCRRLWRDHSLTIVLAVLGLTATAISIVIVWPIERDRWFDLVSSLGMAFLTVAVWQALSGPFVERNKPEED